MRYKLICNDKCYPTNHFKNKQETRSWLFNHARLQIECQHYLRASKDVGHDIDLKKSSTEDLANYFNFTLTKH